MVLFVIEIAKHQPMAIDQPGNIAEISGARDLDEIDALAGVGQTGELWLGEFAGEPKRTAGCYWLRIAPNPVHGGHSQAVSLG